jgi:5-methylcytosine-specific restriction endonuclease McrA
MKNRKLNAEQVWKDFEDLLVPRLRLSVIDRAVYSHLLRHSRLEGKVRLRFSILWLARAIHVTGGPTREAVRRLVGHGVLRLVERSKAGHVVEVRLPDEIRAVRLNRSEGRDAKEEGAGGCAAVNLEEADFLQDRTLRKAIHAREGGQCFYCLRQTTPTVQCLDHVVPRAKLGGNSCRNLVSSCIECNSQKGERPAGDFLRGLYRERRLTAAELAGRLRALDALASPKLRPPLPAVAHPFPRKGCPPHTVT